MGSKYFCFFTCMLLLSGCAKSLQESITSNQSPSDLRYISILDGRETKAVSSSVPTVESWGLLPVFEITSMRKSDGTILGEEYMQYVSVDTFSYSSITLDREIYDNDGNLIEEIEAPNTRNNGRIHLAEGHNFTAGEYYFSIRVSTKDENGQVYSTDFEDGFNLHIKPLLPTDILYVPKNQNLVFGEPNGKTSAPLIPNANPDVSFELADNLEKLLINNETGEISLSPSYVYSGRELIKPTVKVISNITSEEVAFEERITVIITNEPEVMPIDTVYFFYPTLATTGSFPTSGEGFKVQVDTKGSGEDIWGVRDNSAGGYLVAPKERPEENTAQTVLETQTFGGGTTQPTSSWMVTTTQDLTSYSQAYDLSFTYHYMPAYHYYLPDGRTPTDLEVYISTDYTGGDIQDANGNWLNGTWTRVNDGIRSQRSESTVGGQSSGAPWGEEFIGTPYPGSQQGADPDGRKKPGTTFYNKWVRCSYDIPAELVSKNFTVAFKVASYFEGELDNTSSTGRGGTFFFSDFYYKGEEKTN